MRTPSAEMRAIARIGHLFGGRYLVEDMLGVGAMGSAWVARDTEQRDAKVVLKIHEEGFDGPEPEMALQRFLREAETLGEIAHENVCRLLDGGTDPETGEAYLVLESLDGETLEQAMGRAPQDVAWSLSIAGCIAEGLEAVHRAGILHRDIKPTNIVLHREGDAVIPKIIDFGLARPLRPKVPLTAGRVAVGTPGYMAPEQARGLPDLDGRIDVYALGVTLYEMLTAELPVDGPTAMDLMILTVTEGITPPSVYRPDLPAPVVALLEKALARFRDERFESAAAMRDAIRAITG